jgi:pimeloyl-ACP methyl ester carboxylesterase
VWLLTELGRGLDLVRGRVSWGATVAVGSLVEAVRGLAVSTVLSRGYRISYEVGGAGDPVVLVCGLSSSAQQWVDAGFVAALENEFRVIRFDPLGHGASDKPHESSAYGWSGLVADALAVADQEGVDAATWWGSSLGAYTVAELAVAHPGRVRAIVLGSIGIEDFGAGPVEDEPWPDLLRAEGGVERIMAMTGLTDPDEMNRVKNGNDLEALACVVEGMDGVADYGRIDTAVLAYKGSRERYGEWMSTWLDDMKAERYDIDGTNHIETFFRSDEVLRVVRPFLTHSHS